MSLTVDEDVVQMHAYELARVGAENVINQIHQDCRSVGEAKG